MGPIQFAIIIVALAYALVRVYCREQRAALMIRELYIPVISSALTEPAASLKYKREMLRAFNKGGLSVTKALEANNEAKALESCFYSAILSAVQLNPDMVAYYDDILTSAKTRKNDIINSHSRNESMHDEFAKIQELISLIDSIRNSTAAHKGVKSLYLRLLDLTDYFVALPPLPRLEPKTPAQPQNVRRLEPVYRADASVLVAKSVPGEDKQKRLRSDMDYLDIPAYLRKEAD